MKTKIFWGMSALISCFSLIYVWNLNPKTEPKNGTPKKELAILEPETATEEELPCVFMTLMGEQPSEGAASVKTSEKFQETISKGELWLIEAQNTDGG